MDSSATPPHAEYDRWIARGKRRAAWWRRCGQIVFYVVGTLLACAFAALLIASLIDLGQPRIWGTFTRTDCEPRPRHGCRPVGIWISDDRSIVLDEVYLNGWTDKTGTVQASYRPTALLGYRTVDVPALSDAGPWLIGGILLGWVGYVLYKAGSWGDLPSMARRATTQISPARKRG